MRWNYTAGGNGWKAFCFLAARKHSRVFRGKEPGRDRAPVLGRLHASGLVVKNITVNQSASTQSSQEVDAKRRTSGDDTLFQVRYPVTHFFTLHSPDAPVSWKNFLFDMCVCTMVCVRRREDSLRCWSSLSIMKQALLGFTSVYIGMSGPRAPTVSHVPCSGAGMIGAWAAAWVPGI